MSAQSLWIQIPEIIGIPLVALLIIGFIKAATAIEPFTNEQAVDLAMDCTVLATGACGSIFANDTLYAKWGMAAVVYGILVTLVCILFIVLLAWIRRWHNWYPVTTWQAYRNIFIGTFPIALVTMLLILGYTMNPGR